MAIPNGFGRTILAKEVVEILELKYGTTTLYKYMMQLGMIDENHYPTETMIKMGLLAYQRPLVKGNSGIICKYVPVFSEKGITYLESLLKEKNMMGKPKERIISKRFKGTWI